MDNERIMWNNKTQQPIKNNPVTYLNRTCAFAMVDASLDRIFNNVDNEIIILIVDEK